MKYLSIHALNKYIKSKFDNDPHLSVVYLRGEISNYRPHSSGHMYFTVKDEFASISAIMFASKARSLNFRLENGMKVLIKARVSVYEKSGTYQLYVEAMKPDGIGDLALQFEQLKKELTDKGYFLESHKKKIPEYPKSIAILTAKQGDALQDVLRNIRHRNSTVKLTIFPVPVQGKDAYKTIIQTLLMVDHHFDEILLVRGGGSLEDLWNFNEKELVECIYHLHTPLITGIGHETDFTLCDFVSDLRASTPTGAAIASVPDEHLLLEDIKNTKTQLYNLMITHLNHNKELIKRYENHYILKNPQILYENHMISIESYKERLVSLSKTFLLSQHHSINQNKKSLNQIIDQKLIKEKNQFINDVERLELVNPLHLLKKGYSYVIKDNQYINSIQQLHSEDTVQIVLQDGKVDATIK